VFGGNLAEASAGAAREIAARLGTCFVHGADELARTLLDAQGGAVTVDHPHVGAVAVEPNERVGAVAETRVIVARHANVRFEPRKTASPARKTFRYRRRLDHARPKAIRLLTSARMPSIRRTTSSARFSTSTS
jgi:hypothetical protein